MYGYKEDDELGGHDPYSSSKACAEIVTKSFNDSFFYNSKINFQKKNAVFKLNQFSLVNFCMDFC